MGYLHAEGTKIKLGGDDVILRGAGLGGWLNLEGYMWGLEGSLDRTRRIRAFIEKALGKEGVDGFFRTYEDSFVSETDFAYLSRLGFDSVRLPFRAEGVWKDGAFIPSGIARLDQAVAWGTKHHLHVLLDCHAAKGGQTGANIDDSEDDYPHLFDDEEDQRELIGLWEALASRYAEEPWVLGYDLLNEPIRVEQSSLYPLLLPLYRRLINAVREHDRNHLIVLEGTHWATDFSPLDGFTDEEIHANLAFEFHKYWNAPDRESLAPYLAFQKKRGIPLYCGETGENNRDWCALNFPLLEREGIGWAFWSYKKMGKDNSMASFPAPQYWDEVQTYSRGGPFPRHAKEALYGLLDVLKEPHFDEGTAEAMLRLPAASMPAVSFDDYDVHSPRIPGASFRNGDPVSIVFLDGHQGEPNFSCPAGEPFAEEDAMGVLLNEGESLTFSLRNAATEIAFLPKGRGAFRLSLDGKPIKAGEKRTIAPNEEHRLCVRSLAKGSVLEAIDLQ